MGEAFGRLILGKHREFIIRMLRPDLEEKKPGFCGYPWGFRNRVSVVNTKVNGEMPKRNPVSGVIPGGLETGFLGFSDY